MNRRRDERDDEETGEVEVFAVHRTRICTDAGAFRPYVAEPRQGVTLPRQQAERMIASGRFVRTAEEADAYCGAPEHSQTEPVTAPEGGAKAPKGKAE